MQTTVLLRLSSHHHQKISYHHYDHYLQLLQKEDPPYVIAPPMNLRSLVRSELSLHPPPRRQNHLVPSLLQRFVPLISI